MNEPSNPRTQTHNDGRSAAKKAGVAQIEDASLSSYEETDANVAEMNVVSSGGMKRPHENQHNTNNKKKKGMKSSLDAADMDKAGSMEQAHPRAHDEQVKNNEDAEIKTSHSVVAHQQRRIRELERNLSQSHEEIKLLRGHISELERRKGTAGVVSGGSGPASVPVGPNASTLAGGTSVSYTASATDPHTPMHKTGTKAFLHKQSASSPRKDLMSPARPTTGKVEAGANFIQSRQVTKGADVASFSARLASPSTPPALAGSSHMVQQHALGSSSVGNSLTFCGQPAAAKPPPAAETRNRRYWTAEEHDRFLDGLNIYGSKDIKGIARHVGTRNATQVRTHAQKYYLRLSREAERATVQIQQRLNMASSKQPSMGGSNRSSDLAGTVPLAPASAGGVGLAGPGAAGTAVSGVRNTPGSFGAAMDSTHSSACRLGQDSASAAKDSSLPQEQNATAISSGSAALQHEKRTLSSFVGAKSRRRSTRSQATAETHEHAAGPPSRKSRGQHGKHLGPSTGASMSENKNVDREGAVGPNFGEDMCADNDTSRLEEGAVRAAADGNVGDCDNEGDDVFPDDFASHLDDDDDINMHSSLGLDALHDHDVEREERVREEHASARDAEGVLTLEPSEVGDAKCEMVHSHSPQTSRLLDMLPTEAAEGSAGQGRAGGGEAFHDHHGLDADADCGGEMAQLHASHVDGASEHARDGAEHGEGDDEHDAGAALPENRHSFGTLDMLHEPPKGMERLGALMRTRAAASSASELQVAEKWDHALEIGIKRVAYGAVAGIVVAALLFRGTAMRSGVVGMAMGVGVGMTYSETKRDFESFPSAEEGTPN
ncbi:Myb-like protein I [Porphyridium purpureum]|uniref:Myb-like protein I n=1 Tax=Porphyridium purpureum TaxID=35688 RepID=A0A5J4YQ59_PORPP|nr:Myb-like protein I [Porphyridium purpureum]|eukprot:POR7576..scf296_7